MKGQETAGRGTVAPRNDGPAFAAGPPPSAPRHPAHPATLTLWALRTGRIPPTAVSRYLAMASRGESVEILRSLAIPYGTEPVSAHAWDKAMEQVHSVLDSIDWDKTNTTKTTLIERGDSLPDADASAAEWDSIFGPETPEAAERLAAAAAAEREHIAALTDDQRYESLFSRR
jgi:hypothetical protein